MAATQNPDAPAYLMQILCDDSYAVMIGTRKSVDDEAHIWVIFRRDNGTISPEITIPVTAWNLFNVLPDLPELLVWLGEQGEACNWIKLEAFLAEHGYEDLLPEWMEKYCPEDDEDLDDEEDLSMVSSMASYYQDAPVEAPYQN